MNWLFFQNIMSIFNTMGNIDWVPWESAISFVKGYADYTSNLVRPILSVGQGFSNLILMLPSGIWIMLVMLMAFTIVFTAIRIFIDLL